VTNQLNKNIKILKKSVEVKKEEENNVINKAKAPVKDSTSKNDKHTPIDTKKDQSKIQANPKTKVKVESESESESESDSEEEDKNKKKSRQSKKWRAFKKIIKSPRKRKIELWKGSIRKKPIKTHGKLHN